MKFLAVLVLTISVAQVLVGQAQAENLFVASILHFMPPNLAGGTVACRGTIITETHVLTTARCVDVNLPFSVGIRGEITNDVGQTQSLDSTAVQITIHPDYVQGQNRRANIAVVQGSSALTSFNPRCLGGFPVTGFCDLFGWGTAETSPRRDLVIVLQPTICNPTLPQAYCSFFGTMADIICTAQEGSPIACENGSVDGILLNEGSCMLSGNSAILSYHSIAEFRDWINQVTNSATTVIPTTTDGSDTTISAGTNTKVSSSALILAVVLRFRGLL